MFHSLAFKGHGGPRQYLQYHFPNHQKRAEFSAYLHEHIQESTHKHAENWGDLPVVLAGAEDAAEAVYVHPAKFSFASDCSRCGPVELHKAQALIEQYLVDGFLTSTEPLILRAAVTCKQCLLLTCQLHLISYLSQTLYLSQSLYL